MYENDHPGESCILRHGLCKDGLIGTPEEGVTNMQEVYVRNSKKFPDHNFIGTREKLEDGNLGEYKFKTHAQIFEMANSLGAGLRGMNLIQTDKETGC